MEVGALKRRFGVVGNSPALERALTVAAQVATTDISVLVLGESGTGKEVMPRIVHQFSSRKHGPYVAVNCGAIPEGTIDSELFGHEKGAFTGATDTRKGYFEEANGGTIFLDEVAELPLTTQVRLLRVLETGEFMKVGSSKVQKTDVRVVAATNVDFDDAMARGRFREDLYYRLSQVPIQLPPLRKRSGDVHLLFRKFTTDFSEQYRMPPLSLDDEAIEILEHYPWPGNIRQLKNVTEQMSILETNRRIDADTLLGYLPETHRSRLPSATTASGSAAGENMDEREILYKVLFDMKGDLNDLKQLVMSLMKNGGLQGGEAEAELVQRVFQDDLTPAEAQRVVAALPQFAGPAATGPVAPIKDVGHQPADEVVLSLQDSEKELIRRALEKHRNKRKHAAEELGISERTLYRKIKEYDLK
ncbi:MAG: sigma-54 dependent transcriptional regulator [Bacteroidota bacterium]|nr:sigma-54 dependent transcriptional regulator [Bacteroidota bacterium]